MTELPINQKEYLKKYLAIGKAPGEKKKKKKKPAVNRVQIIDDDADVTFTKNTVEDDPLLMSEDAPQIVAIIDERPPSLRVDEKTKNPLWQPIGKVEDFSESQQKQMIKGFKIQKPGDKPLASYDRSPPRRKRRVEEGCVEDDSSSSSKNDDVDIVIKEERKSDDDSPIREYKNIERNVSSPRRNRDCDSSPPRKSRNLEKDISPPRRNKETTDKGRALLKREDTSPSRKSRYVKTDLSPLSKSRCQGGSDVDNSPPRRSVQKDLSPPRRNRTVDKSSTQSRYKDDQSPPRKRRNIERDVSPKRKTKESEKNKSKSRWDNDVSSPRKNKDNDRNSSPSRSRSVMTDKSRSKSKSDNSSPGERHVDNSRREEDLFQRKSNKSADNDQRAKKMEKTLDGKTSGLVNANELTKETKLFRSQQDKLFKSLPEALSGENSETVHRDRQTGRIRNLEEEQERQRKKREEEEKNKEKYERWGRGLAQVESYTQKLQDQLHEMSKPLARYADDEDLEKYLKEKEREGDPMLAYIRKKRKKKAAEAGEETKPQFEGEFMPNRYGIRPGHRWDGVDRSGGYEKKWFEVQNEKRAILEDSYKWSTEDM